MDRLRRAAILTKLIKELQKQGSWCGETHVQKATLFLQELMKVPLGFTFILYKHGPFSFDLRDDLTGLRADELVRLDAQWPYGPKIISTDRSAYIRGIYSKTLGRYKDQITFVAEKLGGYGVSDLERLATALYVTQRGDASDSVDVRSKEVTKLKPHISLEDARFAVEELDHIIEHAQNHIH